MDRGGDGCSKVFIFLNRNKVVLRNAFQAFGRYKLKDINIVPKITDKLLCQKLQLFINMAFKIRFPKMNL